LHPKNWPWLGVVDPGKIFLSSNLITVQKFGCCVIPCARMSELQKFGDDGALPLGTGAWLAEPLETRPFPLVVGNFVAPLLGIGAWVTPSKTYDFLLVIHSNHGPISYRFRDKRRFWSKISNLHTPCSVFSATTKEFPLEFCNGSGAQKPLY